MPIGQLLDALRSLAECEERVAGRDIQAQLPTASLQGVFVHRVPLDVCSYVLRMQLMENGCAFLGGNP